MIVTLNGYPINDGTNGVDLDVQIDGLDIPGIRTSSGNYSGRDGGYIGAQFYAARDISIQGKVFSADIATLETTRKALQAALKGNSITMTILTNAGNSYIVYTNLISFDMPLSRNLFSSPFKIELLATDPTIYDNTGGTALTASISRLSSGGFTTPAVTPIVFTSGGSPTTISNGGTSNVFPTITLTGIMNNPTLTNLTTSQVFSLTSLVTGAGDTVVIDMRQKTVTLNGSSIFGDVGPLAVWWYLQPGNNSVTLTTPNAGDTVTGTISWRPGYPGI